MWNWIKELCLFLRDLAGMIVSEAS
jgi:hypothetical protein